MLAIPAVGLAEPACKFKIAAESGRPVAVAQAELARQNGQMQFLLSKIGTGGVLEVRFKRLGKFNRRFTPPEVIAQLNDGGPALVGFSLVHLEEPVRLVKGWIFTSGTYSAKYELSQRLLARMGSGYILFRLSNLSEGQLDIDPESSTDTSGCANILSDRR